MRRRLIGSMIVCLGMMMAVSACGSTSSTSLVSETSSNDSSSVAYSIPASSTVQETVASISSEATAEEQEPVEPREGDFRVGFWGDTKEVIMELETAEYIGDDDESIGYIGDAAGKEAAILYWFDEAGKFYEGAYMFLDVYNQGRLYIRDYNSIKDSLIAKYGEPNEDEVLKFSSAADYTDEGQALELGFTGYIAIWTTDTTEITLAITSENYEMSIVLRYQDINHEEVHNTAGL